jgi:hypothetical protein
MHSIVSFIRMLFTLNSKRRGKNDYSAVPQHLAKKNNRIHFPKLSEIKNTGQIVTTNDAGYYFCSITYEIEGG